MSPREEKKKKAENNKELLYRVDMMIKRLFFGSLPTRIDAYVFFFFEITERKREKITNSKTLV